MMNCSEAGCAPPHISPPQALRRRLCRATTTPGNALGFAQKLYNCTKTEQMSGHPCLSARRRIGGIPPEILVISGMESHLLLAIAGEATVGGNHEWEDPTSFRGRRAGARQVTRAGRFPLTSGHLAASASIVFKRYCWNGLAL